MAEDTTEDATEDATEDTAGNAAGSAAGNAQRLRREVGVFGAVMMGLGSIVGTGVFVSLGVAAAVVGPAVLLAVLVGALVATCNGLSSAQLAAAHPVAGGTYEYGTRLLGPRLGFLAGWMFLLAKGASAATAALGFAGYALGVAGLGAPDGLDGGPWRVLLALALVATLTLLVRSGIRRSSRVNAAIVGVTVASLLAFVIAGLPQLWARGAANLTPFLVPEGERSGLAALLHASALMFVAYTGYGRIATLGEEVRAPRTTIPRAIVAALATAALLYALVALVAVGGAGAGALADPRHRSAPLEAVAADFGWPLAPPLLALGAVTAMTGVLLNLLLGLSRVLLAMGRRRDAPRRFARLDAHGSPGAAVLAVGLGIAALVLLGDVRVTWSFSAFTVLVYYALTNLAALQLPPAQRRYPRWVAWVGLASCGSLAFFVEPGVWLAGLGLAALGLGVREGVRRLRG